MELIEGVQKTEFGPVPEDWKVGTFGEFMDGFSSGMTPYRGNKEYYKGDIPWITSGELNYNVITGTNETITEDAIKKTNLKIIPPGTFLMAVTGMEAEGTRGSCAITGIQATTNQSCMALYPHKGILETGYLYYFYVLYGKDLALKYSQGTKQQSYNAVTAKRLPITFPKSTNEQNAICYVLNDVDKWLEKMENLIAKRRLVKEGMMQKLLTPKVDWELKKLSETGTIITGGTPDTTNKLFWNGEVSWITPTDIGIQKNIYIGERSISQLGLNQIRSIPKNSLLITCIASIGKNAILKTNGATNQQINAIVLSSEYDEDFVYYLIELNKKKIKGQAGITATAMLSKKDLGEMEFYFPRTKSEQLKISKVLSEIDLEIDNLESKVKKSFEFKRGIMQQLLLGKVRPQP